MVTLKTTATTYLHTSNVVTIATLKIAPNVVTVQPNVLCATRITQPTLRDALFLSQFWS